jgi:DNA-binding PucR family transcriptional regulator
MLCRGVYTDPPFDVGELLFCHPNAVRYRLHRIESNAPGRSLSKPRDVAELCLAFEVHRRLR